jgi:ABC-type multidrug transport system ATPase subunit/ABC-type multidrug transport system permease subunit
MLNLISKFSRNATVSIVTSQAFLVILTVFGGGLFISWKDCPIYWKWLQEISIFTQASRAAIMSTQDHLQYKCYTTNSICYGPTGTIYPCDNEDDILTKGYCYVNGRTILNIDQGTPLLESKWIPFGYLVLLFSCFRLGCLFCMYYPPERMFVDIYDLLPNGWSTRSIMNHTIQLRTFTGELKALMTKSFLQQHQLHQQQQQQQQQYGKASTTNGQEVMRITTIEEEEEEAAIALLSAHRSTSTTLIRGLSQKGVSINNNNNNNNNTVHPLFESHFDAIQYQSSSTSRSNNNNNNNHHHPNLIWKNLTLRLNNNQSKQILIDNVSGVARSGRILALMGPSGAGKTTLLNALSNRAPYATITGEITYNHRSLVANDLMYVPQFDELNPNFTVLETISFVGKMKCIFNNNNNNNNNTTDKESEEETLLQRCSKLLSILGLIEKMHIRCGSLTSGELKRVSVGLGMISQPSILFLDEPTTGLDSTSAYSIVKYLSELSFATNVIMIMTIHQPAQFVFEMLEDLYLLAPGGKLAFFGPLVTTQAYFQQLGYRRPMDINPADYYLDIVNQPPVPSDTDNNNNNIMTWEQAYQTSILGQNIEKLMIIQMTSNSTTTTNNNNNNNNVLKSTEIVPSAWIRFQYLLEYFSLYYYREIGFYGLRIIFLIIVALFLGTLFLQLHPNTNNITKYSGAIFFNIWTILFSAVAATGLLAKDRRQAIEQVKNTIYTPFIYCLAQLMISIPFNLLCAIIFQSIFHYMINIHPYHHNIPFVYAIVITTGHLQLMESIMLTVVAVLRNAMLSVTFAMVVLGYLFLFSGYFVIEEDMPIWIRWISYICPTSVSSI